jgi:hypothetical protein
MPLQDGESVDFVTLTLQPYGCVSNRGKRNRQGILTEGEGSVDLLVLTSSDYLFILRLFFICFAKPVLMRRSSILTLTLQ